MDAMKLMTEGMIKENRPAFNVAILCAAFLCAHGRRARAHSGL